MTPGFIEWEDWQPVTTLATTATEPSITLPVCVCVRSNDREALARTAILHATYIALQNGRQPVTS